MHIGEAAKFGQRFMTNPADANSQPDGIEPGSLLPAYTKMIVMAVGPSVLSRRSRLPPKTLDEFLAKASQTPLFQEKRQAALCSGAASAFIPKKLDDLDHDVMRLIRLDEPIKIRRNRKAAGPHLSARQDVKSRIERSMDKLGRRQQGDVLRFIVCAVLSATRNGHVELTRQIRELGVAVAAHNGSVESNHKRGRVQQFRGRQACQSTAIDVADIVLARLKRTEVDTA